MVSGLFDHGQERVIDSLPLSTSCRSSAMLLSKDVKGLAAFWTKAKYGKMSIEGRDPVNT